MNDPGVRLDYDDLARDYASHRRVHPGVLRGLRDAANTAASRVLEVGCGTGNYVAALAATTDAVCVGLDPSPGMLGRARHQGEHVALVRGRAEVLPFADAAFELVFSVDVIHHVGDRPAFLREAARVLRPGGRLCTVTDSAEDIRVRRPLSSHFPETVAVELGRYPAIATLRIEMERVGFRAIAETTADLTYDVTDISPWRDRAFSSLHLIPPDAFARGLARLESELAEGPVMARSLYTLVWGTR